MGIRVVFFFFSSRRRHTRCGRDWSSDVCSSDLQARVVPVTIRYADADGEATTAPSFLGDETLAESIGRVLRMRSVRVGLRLAPTLFPQAGADRRRLARAAQQAAAREVRRTVIVRAPETATVATELTTTAPLPAAAPAALTIANA